MLQRIAWVDCLNNCLFFTFLAALHVLFHFMSLFSAFWGVFQRKVVNSLKIPFCCRNLDGRGSGRDSVIFS